MNYKQDVNAGTNVALRFINEVEAATEFIGTNPLACGVYHEAKVHPQLSQYEFRKWHVKNFPHSIFFRIDGSTITLEALYAHKMNIVGRMSEDIYL